MEKDTDRYATTMGVIDVPGANLNLELVRSGHAWWYRQYAPTRNELPELRQV